MKSKQNVLIEKSARLAQDFFKRNLFDKEKLKVLVSVKNRVREMRSWWEYSWEINRKNQKPSMTDKTTWSKMWLKTVLNR